ncbi:hypothetical protein KK120_21280 [Virgibacillus dakarensis]|uniref:permease prefix domain 1-containing protein n=1 Tax=Virgibacillus dakarensis TaxID=1917889 RepID=UPI000B44AEE8|nr:permease prefix domain 1-containing protein [Virgibacillus dakarensis]MBT2218340.1 hypothetical protein [Virgibacillus dakarensis]
MNRTEKYIRRVLEQMQSPKAEREEMREELLMHLEEAKKRYLYEGYSEKQAEKYALADFGNPSRIGRELQESIYPFQRGLLYVIGIATIIFGVIFYLNAVFLLHERIIVWFGIQLLIGTAVILAAINISIVGRYFYLVNLLILVSATWSGIDLMMVETAPGGQAFLFSLYLTILIIVSLIFVFRNSYYSTSQTENEQRKPGLVKFSYIMNLLFGVIIISLGLFFMWGFLVFIGMRAIAFVPSIPIFLWLTFYKFQMTYIAKKPLLSLATGFLFSGVAIALPFGILVFT